MVGGEHRVSDAFHTRKLSTPPNTQAARSWKEAREWKKHEMQL